MKRSLVIGRWQPFHDGHRALIDSVLAEGKSVLIAIRDTPKSETDPFTVDERREMIRAVYPDDTQVVIIAIPDIDCIVFGRDVGYDIKRIILDPATEKLSATSVRDELNKYATTDRSKRAIVWGMEGNESSSREQQPPY